MNRIRELRKAKGLTLEKVAKKLNIGTNTLSQYETEKREANYEVLFQLANFFNVSIDYLLGVTDFDKNIKQEESSESQENTIRIIGRGGVFKEYTVTEEQRKAFETLLSSTTNDDDLKF